jgi:hypothetical protein
MSPQEIASKATPGFKYPLERSVTDEDVIDAVSRIERTSGLAELKVLAYAIHLGVLEPGEFSRRLGENDAILKTMHSFIARLPAVDSDRVAELLSHGMAGYHGRVFGNNQDEGWAFTLFDALHESGYTDLLKLFVSEDPARIGIRWATQGSLNVALASRVVATWAEIGDALHVAAAGFLVLASVDSEISGYESMIDITLLAPLPRAIITGRVMGNLLMRSRNPNQSDESARRRNDLLARLTPAISSWMQTPADLRKFVYGASVRNEAELVAFLLTLPLQPRVKHIAAGEGDTLLKRAFQRVSTRVELEERQLMYVAGWMINPLANTALAIRMGPERFEEFLDNLAVDEYTHDFDYSLYLNDRVRAILLCAIGAVVAKINGEESVGKMARETAALLSVLPAGSVTVFGDEALAQLENDFDVTLPSQ